MSWQPSCIANTRFRFRRMVCFSVKYHQSFGLTIEYILLPCQIYVQQGRLDPSRWQRVQVTFTLFLTRVLDRILPSSHMTDNMSPLSDLIRTRQIAGVFHDFVYQLRIADHAGDVAVCSAFESWQSRLGLNQQCRSTATCSARKILMPNLQPPVL